jgi:hypothetical protein
MTIGQMTLARGLALQSLSARPDKTRRQTLAAEELRSKLREGKAETWAHDGVARRTKSEAKKLRVTEPLGGTSTGTARKTEEN